MKTNRHSVFRRVIAGALTLTLAFGPIGGTAYAALTPLSDVPIAAKVAAKPNIVYSLDDSGSMNLNFLPDFVIGNYCRNGNGRTIGNCASGTPPSFSFTGISTPLHAAEFNKLYYNPDVTYDPPFDGTGKQWPTAGARYYAQTAANTNNWVNVRTDPYLLPTPATAPNPPGSTANSANLAAKVAVTMWCNSDWPLVDNTVASKDAAIGVNGEYVPGDGKGGDCRINGRAYDAVNGAPAVAEGYNYPWRKSSGTDNDPTHFWRTGGSKTLWCDRNAPGWPRGTPSCTYACSGGGSLVYGNVAQTCNSTGNVTGPPYTYSPVGCETNPAYQWTWATGGCVGTIGVECLACNRSGVVTSRNGTCSITGVACGTTGFARAAAGRERQSGLPERSQHDAHRLHSRRADADLHLPGRRQRQLHVVRLEPGHAEQHDDDTAAGRRTHQRRHRHRVPAQQFCRLRFRPLHVQQRARHVEDGGDGRLPGHAHHGRRAAALLHGGLRRVLLDAGIHHHAPAVGRLRQRRVQDQERLQHVHLSEVRRVQAREPHQRRPDLQLHRPGHGRGDDAHVRRGDDQLRQLVRVLPHAPAGRQDHVVDRLQQPRQHLPRRLPHVLLEHVAGGAAASGSTSTTSTPRSAVCGSTRCKAVVPPAGAQTPTLEHGAAHRRPLPERGRFDWLAGTHRPDHARRDLPEQLSHPVHRRLHESDDVAGSRRPGRRRQRAGVSGRPRSRQSSGDHAVDAARPRRQPVAQPVPRHDGHRQLAVRHLDVLLDEGSATEPHQQRTVR